MNYYFTYCDEKYLEHAEKLFSLLEKYSKYKIIVFTINFHYENSFKNVIPIYYHQNNTSKLKNLFIKPCLCEKLISLYPDDNFCFLDSDIIPLNNCDEIFFDINKIINYPLFARQCHDYIIHHDPEIDKNYEFNLLQYINSKILNRTTLHYRQACIFLFNNKCTDFIVKWSKLSSDEYIINNWKKIAPVHDETIANCLLWSNNYDNYLGRIHIDFPVSPEKNFSEFLSLVLNPGPDEILFDNFSRILCKNDIGNIKFFHGRLDDEKYKILKNNFLDFRKSNILQSKEQILIIINSQSLGDTIASTPVVRKLYNSYNQKITVASNFPELFANNIYVYESFLISELDQNIQYREVHRTFIGVGGKKNEYGVEKKHNTIDIRQFHAIDLGFMLQQNEMEYDYLPNDYVPISDLPNKYICMHIANTWPSRTYSDENWQKLINLLNDNNIPVVLIGKNSSESGFYNIDKPTKKLNFKIGLDLTNKLDISQCWHVINKAEYFITMDSGLLHLAGTTDANIIQLGSSINYKLRAPYRKGSQDYKYKYIGGTCEIFCASDIKYGVKEWKTIQGVPPLINCLENKKTYECHPDPQIIFNFIKEKFNSSNLVFLSDKCNFFEEKITIQKTNENIQQKVKQKILFIAPHLSTGGSPAYLEWLLQNKLKEDNDCYVVEYCHYGSFDVQRKNILKLLGYNKFYTLANHWDSQKIFNDKSDILIRMIENISPDIIYLNELPEIFSIIPLTEKILKFLYNKNRKFKLIETCHTSEFDFRNKKYFCDEFNFCSEYHIDLSKHLNIKTNIVDMKLARKIRPNRSDTLRKLNLDPNYFHVLNVGLFTESKNQKYIYDLAEKLEDKKVMFHFIGNLCYFDACRITEKQKNLQNCKIWNERNDVDVFMSCMDLFLFPSLKELNPISIKEALSWSMPCYINRLETYKNKYDDNPLISYILNDNLYNYLRNLNYD